MRKRRKLAIVFLVVMITTLLTGCVGEELSKDKVPLTWTYQKRIESVEIKNGSESNVYVTFDVILLDKDEEIRYKQKYEEILIVNGDIYSVDLEDIKPDYISYEKIDAMAVEILNVYDDDSQ